MNKFFNTLSNLNDILSVFFPKLKTSRLEFNEKNSKMLLFKLILIIDAITKSENLYKKRNIFLLENNYWLNLDPIKSLERIALYIRKFDPLSFKMSKTDRQTFLFVIENIVDYLKQDKPLQDSEDRRKLFYEYRFWVENFFKLFDQKIIGEIEIIQTEINDSQAHFNMIDNFYYSNNKVNIPLFPFAFKTEGNLLFAAGHTEHGVTIYDEDLKEWKSINYIDLDKSLFEFMIFNLRLNDAEYFKSKLGDSDDIFVTHFQKISDAMMHSNNKQYYKSYELLNGLSLERLDHPLLYLFQIRNLAYLNKVYETKQLLERFIILFPYYSEGYELMGDIHSKEENYEAALSQYKKSLSIFQNKIISEKIKKCSNLAKSKEEAKSISKDEVFYDISDEVEKKEPHFLHREKEIKQLIEILSSESKKNVLMIGESGVGKSSLIKFLAQKIIKGQVPDALYNYKVKEINFVSLLTGSKYRGQFEEKGLKLLHDLRDSKTILVLEDIHLMMTSAASRGTSLDFISILKPFLRNGSVQVIASTNSEEFKNTVERDNSLLGFFQKLIINQLTHRETEEILSERADELSIKHSFVVSKSLIEEIVRSAKVNIRNRMLPDSAIMILERCVAKQVYKNMSLNCFESELTMPLLSEVLSDMLNLPESFLSLSIKERLSGLKDALKKKIKGQDEALEKVSKGVITSKLGFEVNENKPDGVFLFIGPTGVGKTETALSLAKVLYGADDYLIRLDMSEYMEKYTYSRFVGAAPGYVGYNDANQLTDKVRLNPFSVILIDEVEKGDKQLLNIFLQIFDAGRLTDARGNVVDFSNTTIIMTSNIGTDLYSKVQMGYQGDSDGNPVSKVSLNKSLKKFFSPEFLNRIDEVVVFNPLEKENIIEIIRDQVKVIEQKLKGEGKDLLIEDEVIEVIAERGYSKEYGARHISREIKIGLLEKIAEQSLTDGWEFGNTVFCTVEKNEITVKILNSGIQIEGKGMENMDKVGTLNV